MANVLNIRDKNGKFIPVSALKGEDYVLTDEDKQEIADITAEKGNFVKKIEYDSTDTYLLGEVYIVDKDNVQTSKGLRTVAHKDTIPLRNTNGNFYVGQPKLDNECASKIYVDNAIKNFVTEERVLELIRANMPTGE